MKTNTLDQFVETARSAWGPLSSELVTIIGQGLGTLVAASPTEDWLAALRRETTPDTQLHRDATHGFQLQAHREQAGLYRPPHDHGRSWVAYAVQDGEIEMGAYAALPAPGGGVRLVRRGADILRAGQVRVYLPGDIHDTRCLTPTALLLRFTERDLREDERRGHPIARYPQ